MARKGKVVWQVSREERRDAYVAVQHYALREDGVLIGRFATRNLDGSSRHDWGWKVAARRPRPDVLATLKAKGYAERG